MSRPPPRLRDPKKATKIMKNGPLRQAESGVSQMFTFTAASWSRWMSAHTERVEHLTGATTEFPTSAWIPMPLDLSLLHPWAYVGLWRFLGPWPTGEVFKEPPPPNTVGFWVEYPFMTQHQTCPQSWPSCLVKWCLCNTAGLTHRRSQRHLKNGASQAAHILSARLSATLRMMGWTSRCQQTSSCHVWDVSPLLNQVALGPPLISKPRSHQPERPPNSPVSRIWSTEPPRHSSTAPPKLRGAGSRRWPPNPSVGTALHVTARDSAGSRAP